MRNIKALTLANNYYNCGHHSIHLAKTRKMRYISGEAEGHSGNGRPKSGIRGDMRKSG